MRRFWVYVVLVLGATGCGSSGKTVDKDPFSYQSTAPLDARQEPAKTDRGLATRSVSFAGAGGDRVPALFTVPVGQDGPTACVIYQGGIGTTKEQSLPVVRYLARTLHVGVITIDIRNDSGAQLADLKTTLSDPSAMAGLLRDSVVDLRRTLAFLGTQPGCDPSRIAYVGFSQGGLLGALLSGADTRVRATALLATGGDWARIIGKPDSLILPGLSSDPKRFAAALKILAPYEPTEWVSRISPRPLLLVNGTRDQMTTPAEGRALADAAGPPRQVVHYDGDHLDALSNPTAVKAVLGFLRKNLR